MKYWENITQAGKRYIADHEGIFIDFSTYDEAVEWLKNKDNKKKRRILLDEYFMLMKGANNER